jgi:hypothetical protein
MSHRAKTNTLGALWFFTIGGLTPQQTRVMPGLGSGPAKLAFVITGLVPMIPLRRRCVIDRDGRDVPGHEQRQAASRCSPVRNSLKIHARKNS